MEVNFRNDAGILTIAMGARLLWRQQMRERRDIPPSKQPELRLSSDVEARFRR